VLFRDSTKVMSDAKPARPLSKRISTAPAAPQPPPATIHPSAIIANHANLAGVFPITIGANAVLNPYAKVISNAGPVEIGEGSVIWERAVVGISAEAATKDEDDDLGPGRTFVMLERNCIIESGARVEAKLVGEGTVIEAFATIGEGCVIGKVSEKKVSAYCPMSI
jgi:dynactin-6